MHFSLALLLAPLLLILPLGLDTLGVSLSLGMKSATRSPARLDGTSSDPRLPLWLCTALLFALAETMMPIVGLLIGAALSLFISEITHYVGALLLIALGVREGLAEGREYLRKRWQRPSDRVSPVASSLPVQPVVDRFRWGSQLTLALSVSLDELVVGFSFGSLKTLPLSPLAFCFLIGLQGFLMALIGLTLGRALRYRLKVFEEWCELLSAALLIGLGIWFLFA